MPENPGRMKLSFGTTFHQTHGSSHAPPRPAVAPVSTSSTAPEARIPQSW
jgi:hypothetical protein